MGHYGTLGARTIAGFLIIQLRIRPWFDSIGAKKNTMAA
jgi:hypothetical protein